MWCNPRRRYEVSTRVPRSRQAPDGHQAGGTQPTACSRINRRLFLAPALPVDDIKVKPRCRQEIVIQDLTSEGISTPGVSAAGSGSEGRADAVSRQLHALVMWHFYFYEPETNLNLSNVETTAP